MTTIASRKAKARNLQQKVCYDLAKILNIEYDQSNDDCLIHSREMSQAGCDIILRSEAREKIAFDFECKSAETINLKSTIEQAKKNTAKNRKWGIIWKTKRHHNPIVVIDYEDFIELLNK